MFKKVVVSVVSVLLMLSVIGLAQGSPEYGGTLKVAIFDESPMLDMSMTTADLCTLIGHHVFEGLFEDDGNLEPRPQLVDTYDISDDGLLTTLHLRHGVLFQNGKEMTSEDVLASLKRFIDYTPRGPLLAPFLDHIAASDAYTVELYLKKPCGALTAILAFTNGGAIIIPKEIAEAGGDEPLAPENCIGTGPYMFDEWLPGKYLRLVRFDDYVSRGGDAFGYWGARTAYLDAIEFIPVPEVGTRVAGLESGTYDYATEISADLFDQLDSKADLQTLVVNPASYPYYIFNTKEGIMANVKMRQAILAALDMTPIMQAAFGPEALWDISGSI
ncbi:MAG: ABC transporter substrate-binding protein [Candidatus Bipolaricaulota bacterium]|nr:ABC transporter substrate-binding protein [Candidatus Bipolaricaulota bacterium]